MEKLLKTTQSSTPVAWLKDVHQKDPDARYIVTEISHYKKRSPWPALQPEYLTLLVHPPPGQPQPLAPVLVKVSRDPLSRDNPSRYRLWGPTDDRVTVLGSAANVQLQDEQLHHLTWSIDQAPRLEAISCLIACVHYDIPQNCLFLDKCCYAFAHAILQASHDAINGIPGTSTPKMLVSNSHPVHTIPPGMPWVVGITKQLVTHRTIFYKEEDTLEQRLEGFGPDFWTYGGSCLAYIFPVRMTSIREVARLLASEYDVRRARRIVPADSAEGNQNRA